MTRKTKAQHLFKVAAALVAAFIISLFPYFELNAGGKLPMEWSDTYILDLLNGYVEQKNLDCGPETTPHCKMYVDNSNQDIKPGSDMDFKLGLITISHLLNDEDNGKQYVFSEVIQKEAQALERVEREIEDDAVLRKSKELAQFYREIREHEITKAFCSRWCSDTSQYTEVMRLYFSEEPLLEIPVPKPDGWEGQWQERPLYRILSERYDSSHFFSVEDREAVLITRRALQAYTSSNLCLHVKPVKQ